MHGISDKLNSESVLSDLLKNYSSFRDIVSSEFVRTFSSHGFYISLSDSKLRDVYEFWTTDLQRVKDFELQTSKDVDHFKQSGHLIYWLRRSNPISEINIGEAWSEDEEEVKWQELVVKYGIQYSALKMGFDICRFFEAEKVGSKYYTNEFKLDIDYYETYCHMLKAKNVSPHAVFLTLKSLFYDPLADVRVSA